MKKKTSKKPKGFSLIELLIVVAIILIIAAIAVPNLLRSRMAANESSAAGSERTIATSNVTYATTYGIGYSADLLSLGCPTTGCVNTPATSDEADLIDSQLASGLKSGYTFTYLPGPGAGTPADPINTFTNDATPTTLNTTGVSAFCVDQSNVVRKDPTGTDPASDGTGCDTAILPL